MSAPIWQVCKASDKDLDGIKDVFDESRKELGFVLRPALAKSIKDGELLVAIMTMTNTIIGGVHYHHRRDGQTTLYHLAVRKGCRGLGIGAALVTALRAECATHGSTHIILKCPTELPANQFYLRMGFQQRSAETGKRRALNVWRVTV